MKRIRTGQSDESVVGTNVGDISLWEVGSLARLAHKSFKVWDMSAASMSLQMALLNDAPISVNRSVWGLMDLCLDPSLCKKEG
ncbi:protein TOPLESS-RELATED PROTEIN 2-like [Mangifera indica]|uniref:protein TOPLESS-RELATED PROTEIN 2-like n=1 Tax=Mangifera indica TaxID=29780 RepID=UPI001CFAB526|nr:protein TOPLESS-RELATED PROTEIN 2-like [Mangifera indica]